ncbi:hypothetical protein ACELLULO517_23045 [Acidisoma cellulosilytica]|uniref:Carbohydrate kinase PfkB domain-containing protein n=1 Tax=Acidisoma cellulosilyticum TaxID=2802395 RepID=A0A963Z6T4_9PROT|nr:PfkB family carbohydrate kinase [Acidisoma cellulosilyticum]MCB8883145.1 hypothetical protein [Acidisoma cellulosilyticum]
MPIKVATVGDNCIDRYGHPTSLSTVGGNALNVAVHLARAGMHCAYFGAVGDDDAGRRTINELAANGVDIGHVRIAQGVTAFTELTHDDTGDRVIGLEEFGVCLDYRVTPMEFEQLNVMRHIHLGWMGDSGQCQEKLKSMGLSLSQDLAVNGNAAGLDLAFASAGPCRDRAITLANHALAQGAKLAVVTMGPIGSLASDGRSVFEVGAHTTKIVDTLGAGDTFIAAFLAAQLLGRDVNACLEAGRDAAAVTCTHIGGFPQMPLEI